MRSWLFYDLFVRISSNALLTAKFVLQQNKGMLLGCQPIQPLIQIFSTNNTNAARGSRTEREREREKRQIKRESKSLHMSAATLNVDDNTENKKEFLLRKEEDCDELEEEENNRRRRQLSRLKRERLCRLQKNILACVVLCVVLFVILNVITKMNEVRTT